MAFDSKVRIETQKNQIWVPASKKEDKMATSIGPMLLHRALFMVKGGGGDGRDL